MTRKTEASPFDDGEEQAAKRGRISLPPSDLAERHRPLGLPPMPPDVVAHNEA
jgi:hypothetical protein